MQSLKKYILYPIGLLCFVAILIFGSLVIDWYTNVDHQTQTAPERYTFSGQNESRQKFSFIVVPGILFDQHFKETRNAFLKNGLENMYPGSTLVLFDDYYNPLSKSRIEELSDNVVKEIENSRYPVILIGTSYGGFLTHQIAASSIENIQGVITYGTPYKLRHVFLSKEQRNMLETSFNSHEYTSLTLGAYYDSISPYFLSHYKNSEHKNFKGGHKSLAKGKLGEEFFDTLRQHYGI